MGITCVLHRGMRDRSRPITRDAHDSPSVIWSWLTGPSPWGLPRIQNVPSVVESREFDRSDHKEQNRIAPDWRSDLGRHLHGSHGGPVVAVHEVCHAHHAHVPAWAKTPPESASCRPVTAALAALARGDGEGPAAGGHAQRYAACDMRPQLQS
jgi:hypothetical protein